MPDALGPRKVLVVDDNRVSRHAVTSALGRLGIEDVRAAADGDEALAVLGEAAIDTIICDLNMPRMDGVEFLRYLAARDFRGAVVLVSGEDPRVLDAAGRCWPAPTSWTSWARCRSRSRRRCWPTSCGGATAGPAGPRSRRSSASIGTS